MRTLQEKYNAIQEGKFSKEHFLAEARMQQPQLITRFNGYDDAVQILKNKGMISEISSDTFKSAVDVARGRGEDKRASKLGSTFLNSFVGKPLMGGTISKIDIQKPSFGDYFDVTLEVLIPTQGTNGMYDKPRYLYYDVEKDDWNMKGTGLEVLRQDARVLSQIASKINPDTKYRQGTQHFDIVGMNESYSTEESFKDYSNDALTDMIINLSRYEDSEDSIARVKAELARRKETLQEFSPYGSIAFSGEKEKQKETAPLSSLEVGDLVYIPGVSGDNITVKDKKEDGTVGVGHPHNDKVSYQDGNKEVQVVRRANLKEVTPAQEKYRAKPTAKPTQFKQDIAAAKKMIDAGKSEKEVVAKYGQAAFNAVNAQNLGEAKQTKLTEAKVYSFTLTYNDAKYVQRVLDDAGVDAIAKAGTFDDEVVVRAFDGMGLRRAKQALEADHFDISENVNEAKQTKLTKKSLTDYRYKPTNDMDKYPYEQILRGIRVELETMGVLGTPTAEEYTKALAKVSKNLEKDSIYYTNQVAGVNPKVDLHDKMVTATAKNTVDTFNGMKKAALKEGFKKLIKKVLSEDAGIASRGIKYSQPTKDEYEFYTNPENYKDEAEQEKPRFTFNDHGDFGDETDFGDEPEEREEEEMFEMYGEDSVDESAIGDIHILAQEAGTLKDFLLSVKAQHPGVDLRRDIEELQDIWNNREQGQADYDDIDITPDNIGDPGYQGYESPSDRMYNSDAWVQAQRDMMETKKSLSELLK